MKNPELFGRDILGRPIHKTIKRGKLGLQFMVPPFSTLNARDGVWQNRKRAWLALGIESEIGRRGSASAEPTNDLRGGLTFRITNNAYVKKKRKAADNPTFFKLTKKERETAGTSIFDPVLCEIVYRWFCRPSGMVIDPFAGGSVRGIVAGMMGLNYWGCDLSNEQVSANERQRREINPHLNISWVHGDAIKELPHFPKADFIFTCPPYGNLERYSDDLRDLSTMDEAEFTKQYRKIIRLACTRLYDNRFAAIVVGNYRDKTGSYVDLVGKTIRAFQAAGLSFYNEAILITAVGSLAVRTRVQFLKSRKLGKSHQQLLVFLKGDAKLATRQLGKP